VNIGLPLLEYTHQATGSSRIHLPAEVAHYFEHFSRQRQQCGAEAERHPGHKDFAERSVEDVPRELHTGWNTRRREKFQSERGTKVPCTQTPFYPTL